MESTLFFTGSLILLLIMTVVFALVSIHKDF